MKHELIFIVGIMVNVYIAVLFPTMVGLDDPFGIDAIRTQKFQDLSVNDQEYFIDNGIFDSSGNPSGDYKDKLQELNAIGQGDSGLIITDLSFGFLDFVKVALRSIETILTFFIAFCVLIFNLTAPFNVLLGIPLSTLYIYSTGKLIMGR